MIVTPRRGGVGMLLIAIARGTRCGGVRGYRRAPLRTSAVQRKEEALQETHATVEMQYFFSNTPSHLGGSIPDPGTEFEKIYT